MRKTRKSFGLLYELVTFDVVGNHHLASRLKTYAQICRHHLGM